MEIDRPGARGRAHEHARAPLRNPLTTPARGAIRSARRAGRARDLLGGGRRRPAPASVPAPPGRAVSPVQPASVPRRLGTMDDRVAQRAYTRRTRAASVPPRRARRTVLRFVLGVCLPAHLLPRSLASAAASSILPGHVRDHVRFSHRVSSSSVHACGSWFGSRETLNAALEAGFREVPATRALACLLACVGISSRKGCALTCDCEW
jgi:hypothetical protein